jgi:hypothetical protein
MNILFYLLLFVTMLYADFIKLKAGDSSNTTIVDTSGCYVKIYRNDNIVIHNKNTIDFIVYRNDTINYSNYYCTNENNINSKSILSLQSLKTTENSLIVSQKYIDSIKQNINYSFSNNKYNRIIYNKSINGRILCLIGGSFLLTGLALTTISDKSNFKNSDIVFMFGLVFTLGGLFTILPGVWCIISDQ